LENEPERAYRAFEVFLSLPDGKRTLLEAEATMPLSASSELK